MADNEESPEHGALEGPIERPEEPGIEMHSGSKQQSNYHYIPESVAEGPPGVLNPAMAGNRGSNLRNLEGRRRARIESIGGIIAVPCLLCFAINGGNDVVGDLHLEFLLGHCCSLGLRSLCFVGGRGGLSAIPSMATQRNKEVPLNVS